MKKTESVHERIKQYSQAKPDLIYRDLCLSEDGLNQEQTSEYRRFYGENNLTAVHTNSIYYCIRRAFVNPFSIILFVLAAISFVTDVLLPSAYGKNITTVAIILGMLLISGIVRLIQELRSKRIADQLTKLVHTTIQVRRDGQWKELSSSELVVGDRVRLDAGDRVPADIRLTKANDFFVSQSVITGESGILEKNANPLTRQPETINDHTNTVFFATTVTGGSGEGIVLAVGADTVYGGFSLATADRKRGFDRGANSIAWVLIKFMAILVPVVFIACGLTKGSWLEAFLFALSVAVGLTPELLPMVINACLAKGTYQMGQKQTVVKNINAMQSFGGMDVLCVDKTGTLTGDTVSLEYYMDILGNESQKVLDFAFLNSFYHTGVYNHLDTAILKCREMPGKADYFSQLVQRYPKMDETPFDYNRKFASVLLSGSKENLLIIKGSIDEVVRHCSQTEYRGQKGPIGSDALPNAHAVVDEMLEDGMKVLAVAYKTLDKDVISLEDEQGFTLLGYLAFFDAPKKSAASSIKKLHALHVKVKVLTGDQKGVALSICRRLGISTEAVMTGAELDVLSDNELPVRIEKTNIFAELSPKQKAKIVETLQSNGHTVGYLGDGMNDLPAVVQADVGISVDNAAEAVKESADVILLKKDLNVLEEGILEGRKAFVNMQKYIKITASSNFGNICAVVIASVLLPFFPMTSVQLLLLNLLYDILCLILPWDNVDEELLRKPLEWSGRTLGRFMTFFGPISCVFDILTFAFLYFLLCPAVCGGAYSTLDAAQQLYFISLFQTGWFLESMWTQVLILHLLRTKKLPFLQSQPSRPVVFVTEIGILAFTLLTITPVGALLGLTSMPLTYYGYLVVTVVFYLLLVTLLKSIYLHKYHELI